MVPSTISIFVILLTINFCYTSGEHPKTEQLSKTSRVTSSTGQPDATTRGPHTHDEHPADDPDHSDHAHEEKLKTDQPSEDKHDHPGHDHDHPGHDHDHPGHDHDHPEHDHDHNGQDHDHSGHKHDHPGHDHDHAGHDHDHTGHDHSHPPKDDHEHPGHDHSETGHDHSEDHPEEEAKSPSSTEEPKIQEEVEKAGSYKGNRARRGLWRRRLD